MSGHFRNAICNEFREAVESACNAGNPDSIPGSGRSPGGGHGNPFQYSCLENPHDRGDWRATVQGVAKSWTRLSDSTVRQCASLGLQRVQRTNCSPPSLNLTCPPYLLPDTSGQSQTQCWCLHRCCAKTQLDGNGGKKNREAPGREST